MQTFEYDPPDDIVAGPWELTRGIGHSFGHNRIERARHHLSAHDIVALFTEVIAKGGNLLLNIGPAADGTVPDEQAGPLRLAGAWIRRHHDRLAACSPWTTWADARVRYFAAGADDNDSSVLLVVDVGGRGSFDALGADDVEVIRVEDITADDPVDVVGFARSSESLTLPLRTDSHDDLDVAIYRVTYRAAQSAAALFDSEPPRPIPLAPLLDGAAPGSIVRLGDATYEGPVTVPSGGTLCGLGHDRTRIVGSESTSSSVPAAPVSTLDADAHVEHVAIVGGASRSSWAQPVSVSMGGDGAGLLGCRVDGVIEVTARGALLRATQPRRIVALDADRLHVSRCELVGNRWDVGIELRGGNGHHIESNELNDHLCAIRGTGTASSTIRGNEIRGRWWGVHVDLADYAHVHGNRVTETMRAVDIDGGSRAGVDGNSVRDGDSGCVVTDGAADAEVYGNHWDRCRVGLIAWGASNLAHRDNVAIDLDEPDGALISGP